MAKNHPLVRFLHGHFLLHKHWKTVRADISFRKRDDERISSWIVRLDQLCRNNFHRNRHGSNGGPVAQIRCHVRVPPALCRFNDSAIADPRTQFADVCSLYARRFGSSWFSGELLRWNDRAESKKGALGFGSSDRWDGSVVRRAILGRLHLYFVAGLRVLDLFERTAVSGRLCAGPTQGLIWAALYCREARFLSFVSRSPMYFGKNLLEEVVQLSLIAIGRKGNKRRPMPILRRTLQETRSSQCSSVKVRLLWSNIPYSAETRL